MVGMDDPLAEAEHDGGHDQPAPPQRDTTHIRFVHGHTVCDEPGNEERGAAGKSHEIWAPKWALKRRSQPVASQRLPAVPPPPTLPASLPVSRPKPL